MTKTTNKLRIGAVVFAAALLAACGGKKEEGGDAPADTEAKVESPATDTEAAPADAGSISGEAQKLVDLCVADGESEAVCGCQITAVEDALGADDFGKLIELAKNEDDAGAEAFMTEVMTDKPDAAMKMGMAMMSCAE